MAFSLLCAAILAQQPANIEWKEIFTGKPEFEHCTRVVSVKNGILFIDSPQITHADGGDVYLLKDKAEKPEKVISVDEQGAHRIIRLGKSLVIPGTDATEDWSLGNFYISENEGQSWRKVRNIPGGIHVFDMCEWKGKWYVGYAVSGGAAIYQSDDHGKSWSKSFEYLPKDSFGETLMVLPLNDGLYAHVVTKWGTVDSDADFYKYDGKGWKPLKLFDNRVPCWNYRLDHGRAWLGKGLLPYILNKGKMSAIESLRGVAVNDFEFPSDKVVLAVGKDRAQKTSSIYRANRKSPDEIGEFKRIADLPEGYTGNSLAIRDGFLYVACYAPKGGKVLSAQAKAVLASSR